MSPSAIVQKLWNYCNVLRNDLSESAPEAGGQAGGMSYLLARHAQASGDYPSAKLRAGVEQLTYLLFLKMADERAAWSVLFQLYGFSSVRKWAIMRSCEVTHG